MKQLLVCAVLAVLLTSCNQKPASLPVKSLTSLEALYTDWIAEIQSKGVMTSHVGPDGSRVILGPGFSDAIRVREFDSTKRLANYRPRLTMLCYCLVQSEKGEPFVMLGELLQAAYPGKFSEKDGCSPKMLDEAFRLAEAETH